MAKKQAPEPPVRDQIEQVLDRVRTLNAELACKENLMTIHHLQQAQGWQEARDGTRDAQGVKGTTLPHAGPHTYVCTGCGAMAEIHQHG